MNLYRITGVLALAAGLSAAAVTEAAMERQEAPPAQSPEVSTAPSTRPTTWSVPLASIQAHQMPGTIELLGPCPPGEDPEPSARLAAEMLDSLPKRKADFRTGLAVEGYRLDALTNAHAVLTGKAKPPTAFVRGEPISLVLLACTPGYRIHIRHVHCQSETVEVFYWFVRTDREGVQAQMACIPLEGVDGDLVKVTLHGEPAPKEEMPSLALTD